MSPKPKTDELSNHQDADPIQEEGSNSSTNGWQVEKCVGTVNRRTNLDGSCSSGISEDGGGGIDGGEGGGGGGDGGDGCGDVRYTGIHIRVSGIDGSGVDDVVDGQVGEPWVPGVFDVLVERFPHRRAVVSKLNFLRNREDALVRRYTHSEIIDRN